MLDGRLDLLALAVVAAGFAFRIAAARGTRFSGDEALDFQLANQARLADVYRETLNNAHPPLFFFLLRFWRLLGNSELFLRLLPVAFGTLFLWVAYRWVSGLYGRPPGLVTLILLSFSPAFVPLSAQLRGYSLLLLLMAASAFLLEGALRARRACTMAISSAFLSLAILTHYSAVFLAAALFLYALLRFRERRAGGSLDRVLATWAVSQLAVGVLFGLLAVTHLAHLRGSEMEREVKTRMLRPEYFQAAQDQVLPFLVRQTAAVFRFLCGSSFRAVMAFVLAAAGVIFLAKKREPSALLLALPFILGAAAALLGFYPYGGVRQAVYLLFFASAAIGAALAPIAAARPGAGLALVPVFAVATLAISLPGGSRQAAQMTAAIARLRAEASPGSLVFVDRRAGFVLDYYLGRDAWSTVRAGRADFWESSAGGYRILGSPIWNFTGYRLGTELRRLVAVYHLPAGQTAWLMNVETYLDPAREVSRQVPGASSRIAFRSDDISLVEVVIP